jgi:hypothetical protein
MTIPVGPRIGLLILATTGFYAYVGQMVPQSQVLPPPTEIVIPEDLTAEQMAPLGRQIMETKGLCFTCHTVGRTGALRFPDLAGIGGRAAERVAGLSDIEYFAQAMYEPDAFVVPGFNPGMPAINRPPIALTDREILTVMAYLQSLGGMPSVTLQTSHRYYTPPGAAADAPGATPAAAGAAPVAPGTAPAATGAAVPVDQTPQPGQAVPLVPPPAQAPAPGAQPAAPGTVPAQPTPPAQR